MASLQAASSESDDGFHSIASDGKLAEPHQLDTDDQDETLPPPEHPLKSMQGPFEESIVESDIDFQKPTSRANAELRRQRLLDAARFDDSWTTRWKQRQDAQYHPLLKLMAQITFGMHLLQQNQAKNASEVVKILQTHVDEVDNFLEQTAEDFDLAIRDIDERIRFLQLPMQHVKVFNIMLDDMQFRTQLLDGNDKIERIIDRTARAMNAALLDVQKGRQATRELSKYLNSVQYTWPTEKSDLDAIYSAMRGNEEGWKKCYKDLQTKGNHLGNKLIELGTIIGDMSKMAAVASRRVTSQTRPTSSGNSSVASSAILRSRFNPDARASTIITSPAKDKPLPRAPSTTAGAERTSSSKPRPVSFHQRFEKPREVPTPQRAQFDTNERPKTSDGVRGGSSQPSTIAARRVSGPLSSHPPDIVRPKSAGNDRANGSLKAKSAHADLPRSSSQPAILGTEPNSTARTASTLDSSARNRDSFLSQSRDALSTSSFARRWSIRKKHPGPTPEDYTPPPIVKQSSVQPSSYKLKSPSQQRLTTVVEGNDKPLLRGNATNPSAKVDPPSAKTSDNPPPSESIATLHEPKSRTDSIRTGRSRTRQSMIFRMTAAESSTDAPSIKSSLKRRALSIRGIFGRKSRADNP